MTFFLIIGGIGLVLLLISMFGGIDHDFSVDHDVSFDHEASVDHGVGQGPSFFSFRVLVTFITIFGAVGALCTYYQLNILWSSLIGLASGIVTGLGTWGLMRLAFKQQASSLITNDELLNLEGLITTAIPKNGLGEVSIETKGQRKYMAAKTADGTECKFGTQIIIKEVHPTALIVEPKSNQQ